jgi:hypothetical protein
MFGKGVTVVDCLLAIAIVAPVGLLLGAVLGYLGNRGLSGGTRIVVIVAFAGLAGQFARVFVMRRVKARSTPPGRQG